MSKTRATPQKPKGDKTNAPKKTRKKAHRLNLTDVAAMSPGSSREVSGDVLSVHDDNYKWLPDASVDFVLTDPPFNIARDTNFHTYEGNTINSYRFDKDKGWDTYSPDSFVALLNAWSSEFARVLRPGGSFAVFCADAYVSHLIDALKSAGLSPRRTLTWRKPNAVPINRDTMMMSACEYVVIGVKGSRATFNSDLYTSDVAAITEVEQVLVGDKAAAVVEKAVREAVAQVAFAGKGRGDKVAEAAEKAILAAAKEASRRVGAMYTAKDASEYLLGCVPNHVSFSSKSGNRLHPTEKPVTILRYLLKLFSNPGDVVLDPFAGSGSAGEACLSTGRSCVMVEMDGEFYGKMSARLRTLVAATDLKTADSAGRSGAKKHPAPKHSKKSRKKPSKRNGKN